MIDEVEFEIFIWGSDGDAHFVEVLEKALSDFQLFVGGVAGGDEVIDEHEETAAVNGIELGVLVVIFFW